MIEFIEIIRNSKLCAIRRSLDVICFQFETEHGVYCLNCQCFVRLFDGAHMVASSQDMVLPASDLVVEDESWDWSMCSDGTLFDEQISGFRDCQLSVENARINNYGDISIECKNRVCIEIMISTLSKYESWRFFKQSDYESFTIVCYGTEIVREV